MIISDITYHLFLFSYYICTYYQKQGYDEYIYAFRIFGR